MRFIQDQLAGLFQHTCPMQSIKSDIGHWMADRGWQDKQEVYILGEGQMFEKLTVRQAL